MDPFRYVWWRVRLKLDRSFAISPEDKVDIASRSEWLAEYIFFNEGKNDNLTMANITQIILKYLVNDVDCKALTDSSSAPANDDRPLFLEKFTSAFVRQSITNQGFPTKYDNGVLHNAFIDAGILSERDRNQAISQDKLDELLHVLIWSLTPGQKIALAQKIPQMAEKILFTRQLKLNMHVTDLTQIIEHYAQQPDSRVITALKRKKELILDALESESLADVYISNNLLTPEQIIDVLTVHTIEFVNKHWGSLYQKLLSNDNASESERLRNYFFKVLEEFCQIPNRPENNNADSRAIATRERIIEILSESSLNFSLKDYIDDKKYPTLYHRINPYMPSEASSELGSSMSSSLFTTPRDLTPRTGNVTPRSNDSVHKEGLSTPRSSLSVTAMADGSRNTTHRKLDAKQHREKVLKLASCMGNIALEILELMEKRDDQGLNNCLSKIKQDPDKLISLFDLALERNLPDGLSLIELPKTVTKSLFTYDATCPYSISAVDLINFFSKYYLSGDQNIIAQIFRYYSDIHLQNSGIVNGQLTFPNEREIEKENYDAFVKLIRTRNVETEYKLFIQILCSKYEYAKCILGAPGIINTISFLNSSITTTDGNEKKIRDNEAIKKCFPLLLKAAMNNPEEAKVFVADEYLMSLLKKTLSNEPLLECEHWQNSRLPMNREGIKNELHNLALLASSNRDKDFFENCLITHLLINSFSTVITLFSSQDDMLACIANITPINKPSTGNDSLPYKQNYLAVVNITFTKSEDCNNAKQTPADNNSKDGKKAKQATADNDPEDGNKAKRVTAEALGCSTKDLDDSFMLIPVKDAHTFLTERLTMNGVTPGLYNIDTILEWNTPEKLTEKSLDRGAFKKYLNTDKEPKPKSKLLIPRPNTRIDALSEHFKYDPQINTTTGHSAFTTYTQTIIIHFSTFLTAIRDYISATIAPTDKPLERKERQEKIITPTEALVKASLKTGLTFFSPPTSSAPSSDDSFESSMTATATIDTVAPPAAPTAIAAEINQNEDATTTQTAAKWQLPKATAAGSTNTAPAPTTTGTTNLRIGSRRIK